MSLIFYSIFMNVVLKYMKPILVIIKGFLIILGCYFAGKYLSGLTHNMLSGSVVGMLLLFFLLCCGIVKKEDVRIVADFLMTNLILFFIPPLVAVTLIDFGEIGPAVPYIIIISAISTIIVMAATGLFVQWREKKNP